MSAIDELIKNFGGMSALARVLGHKNPTTVQGWKQKGKIPEWRLKEVIEIATKNNITIPKALKSTGNVKVLIADDLSKQALKVFAEYNLPVDVKVGLKPEQLAEIIADYDGLVVRSSTQVTSALLEKASRLKVVGRAGIGIDNIDMVAATQKGVIVMNTPNGNSVTTAEHTISMLLSVARSIPQANASTHDGKWEKKKFVGVEVFNKTLGLIGIGNIGSIVAERAQGLKMKVVAYDPFLSESRAKHIGVKKADKLEDLLQVADFISVHTPLTESTRGLINKETIAQCKDGVRIINCARGGIVDEADLLAALDSGKVAGAGLDVFTKEPAKKHILFGHPLVVATPHLGASTHQAQVNVAIQVAEQISDLLINGGVKNALNMPAVSAEDAVRLRPYMQLTRQMGEFIGQMIGQHNVKNINIELEGACAELTTQPITQAILAGIFSIYNDTVNMVNAVSLAKQRDIDVSVTKHQRASDYSTAVHLTVQLDDKTVSVSGSLFGADNPRIIALNGIALEAELGAHMLYIVNYDVPGHIGYIGALLGEHHINIGTFALGRDTDGMAISLIQVDEALSQDVLGEIKQLPSVLSARKLSF